MTATLTRASAREEARPRAGAAWRGRWRVAMRGGWRDVRRHKGRTALVALMIGLPVALGSAAVVALGTQGEDPVAQVAARLGPSLQADLTYLGGTVDQRPDMSSLGSSGNGVAPLADVEADVAGLVPSGDRAVRSLVVSGVALGDRLQRNLVVVLTDLSDGDAAARYSLASGALPGPGEAVLPEGVVADLGLSPGDTFTLRTVRSGQAGDAGVTVRLSGSLRATESALVGPDFPLHPPDPVTGDGVTITWQVAGPVPLTWDVVERANALGFAVFSRAVVLDPPEEASGPDQSTGMMEQLRTWAPLAAVILIVLLEVVLLIGPVFAVGARRDQRTHALLLAAGGDRRTVRASVLGVGVAMGLVATAAGLVVGISAALTVLAIARGSLPFADGLRLDLLDVGPLIGVAVVGVLFTVVAAWLPSRRASRVDPVLALAGRRAEPRGSRGPAVVGVIVGVLGYVGAVVAGLLGNAWGIAGGAIAGQLGLVLASGALVDLMGGVAGRLPVSWRFAFRDAARQRSRTAPAVAAVLVATAGATAGFVYAASQSLHDVRTTAIGAEVGTLMVTPAPGAVLTPEQADRIETALAAMGLGPMHRLLTPAAPGGDPVSIWVQSPLEPSRFSLTYTSVQVPGGVIDDGSHIGGLGIPEPDVARAALAQGKVVVPTGDLQPDGTVRIRIAVLGPADPITGERATVEERTVDLPAVGVGDRLGPPVDASPVLPPSVVTELGLETAVSGFVGRPTEPPSQAQLDTAQADIDVALGAEAPILRMDVAYARAVDLGPDLWLVLIFIGGGGGLLALAAAWIAAALAATESRPDLATLAAVGATPRTRKGIVAAQAGTIVVLGVAVGVPSGLALGTAFVLWQRNRNPVTDVFWTLEIPWFPLVALLMALPVLAVAAAWLMTRGRLVLTRRLDT